MIQHQPTEKRWMEQEGISSREAFMDAIRECDISNFKKKNFLVEYITDSSGLELAIDLPKEEIARYLLEEMIKLEIKIDKKCLGELFLHATKKKLPTVVLLFRNNSDLDISKDDNGWTALHWAVANDSVDIVRHIIHYLPSILATDKKGLTALHHAIRRSNSEMVEILLESNEYTTVQPNPMYLAAECCNVSMLKLLASKDYYKTIDISDPIILHPLKSHNKTQEERLETIDYLIEIYGNHKDQSEKRTRKTALHYAAEEGWSEIVKRLIVWDEVLIESSDVNGNSPLHLAAQKGCLEVIDLLFNAGADLKAINNQHKTPVDLVGRDNTTVQKRFQKHKIHKRKASRESLNIGKKMRVLEERVKCLEARLAEANASTHLTQ